MAFWLDMTSSEAGHWSVWSYVLHGSYASCRNIRVALVLERRWHILRLSKHQCLWMRPLPKIRVHSSTHRHIIYDLYEYIGYIRIHRATYDGTGLINMKRTIFLVTFHFYLYMGHALHTYASACQCHAHACTTLVRLCHILTFSIRVPHTHKQTWSDVIWCDVACQINEDYDDSLQDLARASLS